MKKLQIISYLVFLFAISTLLSCTQNSDNDPQIKGSYISNITPTQGVAGTEVIIKGDSFGATVNENLVYFNEVAAEVIKASATELLVRAPKSTTGEIKVKTSTQTSKGSVFTYLPNTGKLTFKTHDFSYQPRGELMDGKYWIHGSNPGTGDPTINVRFPGARPTISGTLNVEVDVLVVENSYRNYKNASVPANIKVNQNNIEVSFSAVLSDYYGPMSNTTSGSFTCYF
jgi:hypothetical protein